MHEAGIEHQGIGQGWVALKQREDSMLTAGHQLCAVFAEPLSLLSLAEKLLLFRSKEPLNSDVGVVPARPLDMEAPSRLEHVQLALVSDFDVLVRRVLRHPYLLRRRADDDHGRVEGSAVRVHHGQEFGLEGAELVEHQKVWGDTRPGVEVIRPVHLDERTVVEGDAVLFLIDGPNKLGRSELLNPQAPSLIAGAPDNLFGLLERRTDVVTALPRSRKRPAPKAVDDDLRLSPLPAALHKRRFNVVLKHRTRDELLRRVRFPVVFGVGVKAVV